MRITVAHSPDSDDAFMFAALALGRIDAGPYEFVHVLEDIETLNRKARDGVYEVTAFSIHAFAHLAGRYALLNQGASMGEGYGPRIVALADLPDLAGQRVATPGEWTSAHLALRLFAPRAVPVPMDFDRIFFAVRSGEVEAGVVIHEGQLTFAAEGFRLLADLGVWWRGETGLPLPLGGNGVRRDLGERVMADLARLLRESIAWGLSNREEALDHALRYGRGLTREQADRFVSMYVNERTLDYGEDGRRAVREFLDRAFRAGLVPHPVEPDFLGA
ncbi:MAG: ABC transporter substrate-binding protein [Planctomycetes bacterium]|jgi:1,4-dihydroxy-6-naphthoate synthase|nr:ABC transporter substrate-binding protein [Planctomycetota bacterium]